MPRFGVEVNSLILSPCTSGGKSDFLKEISVLLMKEGRMELGG